MNHVTVEYKGRKYRDTKSCFRDVNRDIKDVVTEAVSEVVRDTVNEIQAKVNKFSSQIQREGGHVTIKVSKTLDDIRIETEGLSEELQDKIKAVI